VAPDSTGDARLMGRHSWWLDTGVLQVLAWVQRGLRRSTARRWSEWRMRVAVPAAGSGATPALVETVGGATWSKAKAVGE
jgi:hypothetical protein